MAVATGADVSQLEAFIEAQLEPFKVPGVAVAIIKGEEVLLARGFGKRSIEKNLPMTADSVMPIGSVTKSFTSALVATLVDEEKLEWDKPVRDYLPDFRMHDPVATDNMTARDLLSHRSGLPRHDFVWYGNEELTRAEAVKRLRHLKPNLTFRQGWQYNNLMYLTAGYLCEQLLGMTWEEGVHSRILEPLGMSETTFTVGAAQAADDHARPYVLKGETLEEVPYRGIDLAGPAGSINSSVADMARWAIVHANTGSYQGKQVISPDAIKQLHANTMVMPATAEFWPENSSIGYGLGWMIDNYRGHKVVQHGGNIDGFSAMLSTLPAENLAVVVLANRNATPLRDVLPLMIFDHLLGLEPIAWNDRYRQLFEGMTAGMKEAKTHRATTASKAPSAHPLEAYAGRYNHPGYGTFTFRHDGDKLMPEFNTARMRLNHLQHETFELEIEPFDEGQGLRLQFATDFDGEVSAVRIALEPSVDPIEFKRLPDEALKDAEAYKRFAGQYAIGPIVVEVTIEGDDLYAQATGQQRTKLTPKRPGLFAAGESGGTVEFVEEDGKIVRLISGGVAIPRVD